MPTETVTLITGTSKGIGRALVEHYLKLGHLVIGCNRTGIDWQADNYQHFVGDVTDEKFIKSLMGYIRREYGRLDNLINNAGIAAMNHSLLTPTKVVERIFNTNFMGTFMFCREAAKLMKKHQFGRMINFTTVAVPLRLAGEAVYAASKAAVINLTQILAKEFSDFGITVNAIGPTPINTDLIRSVPEDKLNRLLESQAVKRFGKFEDVSNVIDFFVHRNSGFITGQTIFLGGVS